MDNILNTDNLSIQPDNGKLQKPMTNHSFKKEELDWPTIYKLLAQTSERKLERMCKEKTIKDLPKRWPKNTTTTNIYVMYASKDQQQVYQKV